MNYRDELEDYYAAMKGKSSVANMAKKFIEDNPDLKITYLTARKKLFLIQREQSEAITTDGVQVWKVINNSYIWEVNKNKKSYSVSFIDELFLHYSSKGYNFSRTAILQRFDLTPKNFTQIQQAFFLYKDSDILSPHTMTSTPKEELEVLIENQLDKLLRSGEVSRIKHDKAVSNRYKRVISKSNIEDGWRNDVIAELLSSLPLVTNIEVKTTPARRIGMLHAAITDIHAGGNAEKMKITEDWSINKMIESFHRVADLINAEGSNNVTLSILGDLVETVSGINHLDSWKGIEQGMFGAHVIINTYEIIVEHLINRIHNLKRIVGVGGNHDRLQASNHNDDRGATDLIFYLLQERMRLSGNPVEVLYDPIVVAFEMDTYGVIAFHGDKGLHKRSVEATILDFAIDPKKFQFIMEGHWHTRRLSNNDDTHRGRKMTLPSIITGNKYSDVEVGKSCKSGMTITYTNMFGEPGIKDESI